MWLEAGLALYPDTSNPDAVKIVVEYIGEHRFTEAEQADGATVQVQLAW